jgi:predicted alpha/beta hydrolase family esterase
MKKQVFYIHGGESFENYDDFIVRLKTKDIWDLPTEKPTTKWTKHLATDLGDAYEVFMPQMPNAQNASYKEWKIWFERHFEYLHDGVILIGCSLGAMFLLKYFIENTVPFKVKALFIMAAVVRGTDLDEKDCGDFLCSLENVHIISDKVEQVNIVHSKDDLLSPYEHGQKIHDAIPGSKLITFEDKNHFIIETFPELIEEIKGLG